MNVACQKDPHGNVCEHVPRAHEQGFPQLQAALCCASLGDREIVHLSIKLQPQAASGHEHILPE